MLWASQWSLFYKIFPCFYLYSFVNVVCWPYSMNSTAGINELRSRVPCSQFTSTFASHLCFHFHALVKRWQQSEIETKFILSTSKPLSYSLTTNLLRPAYYSQFLKRETNKAWKVRWVAQSEPSYTPYPLSLLPHIVSQGTRTRRFPGLHWSSPI